MSAAKAGWRPVPMSSCQITDPFWREWQRTVIGQTLPHEWEQCEKTGRIENFRRAARREKGGFAGYLYNDSDVFKWAEAAVYAAALDPESPTRPQLEEAESLFASAQADDGYLDTFVLLGETPRWNALCSDHELYCMGHLIEAGCARRELLGSGSLYETAQKAAGAIAAKFGPSRALGYPGHQEAELALCRLASASGDESWRDLGRWMIERRGRRPSPFELEMTGVREGSKAYVYSQRFLMKDGVYDGRYLQDDRPLEDQDEPVGHSVRAMYNYCGAHDAYPLGMPEKMQGALKSIWRRLIDRRTYVTGGIGSSAANEGFTHDYDLPNLDAYAETCAGIGLIFWAWRMAGLTQEAEPFEVLERTLYNAVLSGLGQDGKLFFYDNPLESAGAKQRSPWFDCACCPPNVARLILSLNRYAAYSWPGGAAFGLLFSSRVQAEGLDMELETGLPWNGQGELKIIAAPDEEREIRIRAPRWGRGCPPQGFELLAGGWWSCRRVWKAGESVSLDFSFTPEAAASHSKVLVNAGRRAVLAGPLVYCLEEPDLGASPSRFILEKAGGLEPLSGLGTARMGVRAHGRLEEEIGEPAAAASKVRASSSSPLLIPYYSWANRGPASMMVWMRGDAPLG